MQVMGPQTVYTDLTSSAPKTHATDLCASRPGNLPSFMRVWRNDLVKNIDLTSAG